jgi:uncharacterized Zn finger protein
MTDLMTCPACHAETQPEYRTERVREGVLVRARCSRCGRLWTGVLSEGEEGVIDDE